MVALLKCITKRKDGYVFYKMQGKRHKIAVPQWAPLKI